MAVKTITIETEEGYNIQDIGANAENIDIYRNSSNQIVTNMSSFSGTTTNEKLATTLKNLENKVIDESHGGIGTRGINATVGGVQNSQAVSTAGALYGTKVSLQNQIQSLQQTFQDGVNTIADELVARKGSLIVESATVSTPTPYDVAHNINMMMYELYMDGLSLVADNSGDSSAGEGTGIAEITDGHGNSYYEVTEGDIMNLMRLIAESNYNAGRNT